MARLRLLGCGLAVLLAGPAAAVPSFEVNLDAPPRQRWRQASLYYKDELPRMLSTYMAEIEAKLGNSTLQEWLAVRESARAEEHDEVLEELTGIVEAVDSPAVTVPRLLLWGLLYELASPTACAGMLATMPNGTVVHGRNMDYSFHWKGADGKVHNWPSVTFEAVWTRGGEPLFVSVNWPGHVGVHTGMRLGGWTFEQNTRTTNAMEANLAAARRGGKQFGAVARKAMEKFSDFESARDFLYNANYMAPMYFVMAGAKPYEGAVLTIDRGGKHLKTTPPMQLLSREAGMWHLVQTNDDLNMAPRDHRRPLLNFGLMGAHPEEVDAMFVEKRMTSFPALVPETVFTWVAVPATGYHRTVLRGEMGETSGVPPPAEARPASRYRGFALQKAAQLGRHKWLNPDAFAGRGG